MKKKPVFALLAILAAVCILAACAGGASSAPISSGGGQSLSSTETGGSTAPPQTLPVPSATSAEPASEEQVEQSIAGIVDDVAMGKLYLLADDGRTYVFAYTEADISQWTDSRPGARAEVFYYGVIVDGDTSRVTVTRIVTLPS